MNHPYRPHQTSTYLAHLFSIILLIGLAACSAGDSSSPPVAAARGTARGRRDVGERLFLDTRFAQTFKVFVDNGGNVNNADVGDSVVATLETVGAPINPGPFKGTSMNCRTCHLVDDALSSPGGGMRAYADFAHRTPIPARTDGMTHTPRNSPSLVNSSLHSSLGWARRGVVSPRRRVQFYGRSGRWDLYQSETSAGFPAKKLRPSHTSQRWFGKTRVPLI